VGGGYVGEIGCQGTIESADECCVVKHEVTSFS
jgi:hypothetical protein